MQTCMFFPKEMDGRNYVYQHQYEWLAEAAPYALPMLFSGLGGWFGSQGGGSAEQILLQGALRPNLRPEEQAWLNILADVYTGRLYQQKDEYKMLMDIWRPTSPQAVQTVTETYGLEDPYRKAVARVGGLDKGTRKQALDTLNALRMWQINRDRGGTMSAPEAQKYFDDAYKKLEGLGISREQAEAIIPQIQADPKGFEASLEQYQYIPYSERKQIAETLAVPEEKREGPLLEPTEVTKFTPWQEKEEYAGTPLVQALEALRPENILKQIDIQEQMAQRGLGDWYSQATREASQRGITAYGGYEGSGPARDRDILSAQLERMRQELGWTTGQARAAAERNAPLEALQLLTPLYQWEKSFGQAGQSEALAGLQQMTAIPWGQTSATTTNYPGPGVIPGAIAGGYGGYQLGQGLGNLGWWGQPQVSGQPATAYGIMPSTYGNIGGYEGWTRGYAY